MIGTSYGSGDGSTTFNVPDFREAVPVGAGESTRNTITAHDVYTVGEFKDDVIQGHGHRLYNNGHITSGGLSPYIYGIFNDNYNVNPVNCTKKGYCDNAVDSPVTDGTNGAPRTGTTTHGKQLACNFIIKY